MVCLLKNEHKRTRNVGEGEAMSEWQECKLGDVVATNTKSVDKNYPFNSILYLDTGSITKGKVEAYQEIDFKDAPSRAKRLIKSNDIVYSTVRPIQRHYGIIKNPQPNLVVSTGFTVIEVNQTLAFPEFIYYLLTSDDSVELLDVIAEASTSTYPSLKPSDIENLDISLPPLEEQKSIASVLSSLDDKIDLLHRQNTTLESMAETLFRQWFVEEAQEYWEEVTLSSLCTTITKGTTPTTLGHSFVEEGINFIKAESITDAGGFINEKFAKISPETHVFLKRSIIQKSDVLCSIAGTIGRVAIVEESILPANTNQAIAILRVNENKCFAEFIYLFLKSDYFKEVVDGKVVHAVQPNLSLGEIGNTTLKIAPIEKLTEFKELINGIFDKKTNNLLQIQTLEKLRDNLLPKLISGEVKIKDEVS
jgi:type I restriction enzyme, S subunit